MPTSQFTGVGITGIAAGGPMPNGAAFVAIGRARVDPLAMAEGLPAAWWSPDGHEWHRASAAPDGGVLLATPDGWLAWDGSDVWNTSDGERWERVASLGLEDGGASDPMALVALGDCIIAAGHSWVGSGDDERYVLRMWVSTDTLAWVALPSPSPLGWNDGQLVGLTSIGDALVGWGSNRESDRWVGVVVRSTDGRTWETGAGLAHRGYQTDALQSVAVGPSGLTAVGASLLGEAGDPGRTGAWTSVDGLGWTPATFHPEPSMERLGDVVWDGDRFVAIGRPGVDVEVWLSPDGAQWRRAPNVPDADLEGVEEGCTGSAFCPNTWIAGVVAGPGALVAYGATDGGAVVWVSPRLLTGP